MANDREFQEQWSKLAKQAKNGDFTQADETVDITVKEVLIKGSYMTGAYDSVIVRDDNGKIWIVEESTGDSLGPLKGLISRHNVREGMKLRLVITRKGLCETKAYTLTPEREPVESGTKPE